MKRKLSTKPALRGSVGYSPSQVAVTLRAFGLLVALALAWMAMAGCDAGSAEVTEADKERVVAELQGRSFRQFDPHLDASPRKAVILDFTGGITLWAQYSEEGHAVNEWEVFAESYSVDGSGSEFTLRFNEPGSAQEFPTKCDNCTPTSGVSISVRDVFDSEKISFRLNDPDDVLPPPFPVFGSWTRFSEDEYFN